MACFEVIVAAIEEILRERGDSPPALRRETRIAETGLDSLDVAALVSRLEERLGVDPFVAGDQAQYPRTLGELTDLYARGSGR